MHETFNQWIETYGTFGVFLVTTIEGEFGPLIGGSLARLGKLDIWTLLLACWVGATLSTTAFFAIGRWQRDGTLVHKVTDRRAFALALKWIDRHPRLFCFFYRFVYGLRIVGPVTISLSRVRWQTFILLNTISSFLWAVIALAIGWFIGGTAARIVAGYFAERPYLVASVAAFVVLLGVISWRARRSARRRDHNQDESPSAPSDTAA